MRTRLFDYAEAQRLRASGLTYPEIAARLGVSRSAVRLACNPDARERNIQNSSAWQRQGVCVDCGETCSRTGGITGRRCVTCSALARASSVRDEELQCALCREWKPDRAYPRNRAESGARRGRHGTCRVCQTEMKRKWRESRRVPCGRCGEPRHHLSAHGLCRRCYDEARKRVAA